MTKVAIVYLYPQFVQHIKKINDEFSSVEIKLFCEGKHADIVKVAKKAEREKFDAIVCGGFTYDALIGKVDIPLISTEPALSDLIYSWLNLKRSFTNIKSAAVFLFHRNSMLQEEGLEKHLSSFFDAKIEFVKYKSIAEYRDYIDCYRDKVDVIIGGAHSVEICKEKNIRNYFLGVGVNTLRLGVLEAIRVADAKLAEVFKRNQIQAVLDSSNESIIYVDNHSRIELMNNSAIKFFDLPGEIEFEQLYFSDIIPNSKLDKVITTGEPILEDIQTLPKGNKIVLNMIPVDINSKVGGVAITFKDVTQLIETEKRIRADLHRKGTVAKYTTKDILGKSELIEECRNLIKRFGKFDANVLLYGETGTGKELFAQSIHNESKRMNEPFYAINCASLPENLLESELFGYTEGAFTGAKKGGKQGIFELAHGGTIYLDEIGEMSLSCQSKLLRVLQEKEVRKIGDDRLIPVDVRIVAASNKNLSVECTDGNFREDLFYRINVMNLTIPPLRERKDDILSLIEYYIEHYSEANVQEKRSFNFEDDAIEFLLNYPWTGNVRELQNFVQRLLIYRIDEDQVSKHSVENLLMGNPLRGKEPKNKMVELSEDPPNKVNLKEKMNDMTVAVIKEALETFDGNITKTAEHLGINRTYIYRKIKEES